jgi:hypothetical protein
MKEARNRMQRGMPDLFFQRLNGMKQIRIYSKMSRCFPDPMNDSIK